MIATYIYLLISVASVSALTMENQNYLDNLFTNYEQIVRTSQETLEQVDLDTSSRGVLLDCDANQTQQLTYWTSDATMT